MKAKSKVPRGRGHRCDREHDAHGSIMEIRLTNAAIRISKLDGAPLPHAWRLLPARHETLDHLFARLDRIDGRALPPGKSVLDDRIRICYQRLRALEGHQVRK